VFFRIKKIIIRADKMKLSLIHGLLITVAVAFVYVLYHQVLGSVGTNESFANKADKIKSINGWWQSGKRDYVSYRNATKRESNIVEYTDVYNALKKGESVSMQVV
jgi:hypothetical protein